MQTTLFTRTTKWSEDFNLVLIYAIVLCGVGYLAAMSSIPDRAVASQSTSMSVTR